MKIINQYLWREVTFTFLAVLGVIASIFISHRFARYLADSIAGHITGDVLAILVGFDFLSSLTLLIPVALFFSILLALGRMYKDSEMHVMQACGISQWQILWPVLQLGLACSALVAVLSLYVTPWIISKIDTLRVESGSVAQFTGIMPGQFKLFQAGKRVFYFEDYARSKAVMRSIFVYQSGKNGTQDNLVSALSGRFETDKDTGAVSLILEDGVQYQGTPGSSEFRVTEFKQNSIRVQKQGKSPASVRKAAQPLSVLLQSKFASYHSEFHWRLSLPIATLIMVVIAVPLSRTSPRQGRYSRVFVAIIIYILYNNLIGIGRTWIDKGVVAPALGLWWIHAIFFVSAVLLMLHANGTLFRMRLRRAN